MYAKNVRHVGHFRWLGPNVWWEISQIYIEYIKPIRTWLKNHESFSPTQMRQLKQVFNDACIIIWKNKDQIQFVHLDGLVQERRNSIANALKLLLSCTKPSIWTVSVGPICRPMRNLACSHVTKPLLTPTTWTVLRGLIQCKDAILQVTSVGIPIVEIRWSCDCLISRMRFPIVVRQQIIYYIKSGPIIFGHWLYPILNKVEVGYTGSTLYVSPSVCLSAPMLKGLSGQMYVQCQIWWL